jgi:Rab-GTPase-TBC domain
MGDLDDDDIPSDSAPSNRLPSPSPPSSSSSLCSSNIVVVTPTSSYRELPENDSHKFSFQHVPESDYDRKEMIALNRALSSKTIYSNVSKSTSHQIEMDVGRTLIHSFGFTHEATADAALRRMLYVYSAHDSEVGYCQGMNFVAGFLLSHWHDEIPAYWMFHKLMLAPAPGPRLRRMFTQDMYRLKLSLFEFFHLFHKCLPSLFDRFNFELDSPIAPELYCTSWFATLFANRSIPRETVSRIWDMFITDRWKAIHRVGLAILKLSQSHLESLNYEGTVQFLSHFPDQTIFEPDRLIHTAMQFKVTNRMLHDLEAKFAVRAHRQEQAERRRREQFQASQQQ